MPRNMTQVEIARITNPTAVVTKDCLHCPLIAETAKRRLQENLPIVEGTMFCCAARIGMSASPHANCVRGVVTEMAPFA